MLQRWMPFMAILLRMIASAAYLGLLWLVTLGQGNAAVADLIAVTSICFVSATLGRIGSDQQMLRNAIHFRRDVNSRALSILFTHLVSGGILTGIAAFVVQFTMIALFGKTGTSLPIVGVVAVAALFAAAQTCAAAAHARGLSLSAVLIFPLTGWAIIAVAALTSDAVSLAAWLVAFAVSAAFGLIRLMQSLRPRAIRLRWRWLRQGGSHYVMALNFAGANWVPNLFLQALLLSSDVVLINMVMRLAAILNMPANAAISVMQPEMAVAARHGRHDEIESMLARLIRFNVVFQLVALIGALAILKFTDWIEMDGRATQVAAAFVLASLLAGVIGPSGAALSMMGRERTLARISTAMTVAGIVGGYLAASQAGAIGYAVVAAATTIAQQAIYASILLRKYGVSGLRRALTSDQHHRK